MSHYDKLPPHREAAVNDAPADAKAAPSWEADMRRAQDYAARSARWIADCRGRKEGSRRNNPHKNRVFSVLLSLVRPGTRTVYGEKWDDLKRRCGIEQTCLYEALRSLKRDSNLIKTKKRGRGAADYIIADVVFETPVPPPTVHGPVVDGPLVPIRTSPDLRTGEGLEPGSSPDLRTGEGLEIGSFPDLRTGEGLDRSHKKRTRARAEGGGGLIGKKYIPPPSPSLEGLDMAAILRAFKKYAEKAEFSGARHLARTCRKNDPTCTTEEIVAALHYKGHDLEGADDNFAVLFRKVPEYFTDEYRQFWLDFKANPPERVYTKTELREMKLQAEARVGLYVPRDERHPPQTGVNDFLRGNADKLDCASLPGAAQKIAAESAAELRAVAASSEAAMRSSTRSSKAG